MLNVHNGIKNLGINPVSISDYPAIKAHLDNYWYKIQKRSDKGVTPYNLRNCAYMNDFSKQKIVWGEISDKPKFAVDLDGKYYAEATTFFMTGNVPLKYLVCFLNSSLSEYFFSKIGTTTGVGTVRWKKYKVETLPIPVVSKDTIVQFEYLFDKLLHMQKSGTDYSTYEKQIDYAIYKLFELTEDEVLLIESQIN